MPRTTAVIVSGVVGFIVAWVDFFVLWYLPRITGKDENSWWEIWMDYRGCLFWIRNQFSLAQVGVDWLDRRTYAWGSTLRPNAYADVLSKGQRGVELVSHKSEYFGLPDFFTLARMESLGFQKPEIGTVSACIRSPAAVGVRRLAHCRTAGRWWFLPQPGLPLGFLQLG